MSEPPREMPSPLSWKVCLPPLALCAFLFTLAAVASFVQEEPDTDESVYLAMAEAWAREGSRPYGDFFHAHPPGLLTPAALVFSIVPPSIPAGRLVSLLSLAALFVLVLACARTVEREEKLPGTTIFAGTLFLTSPLVHLVGAGYLGLNLPAALILGAFLLTFRGKPAAAGFLTGLSLTVRLSTLPVAAVLAVVHRRKPAFFLGAAVGALPLLLALLLWSGCFGQCVGFHLRKESMLFGARLAVLGRFLYEEKVLLLFAVPALFLLRGPRARPLLLAGFCVLLFASVQKVVWPYYYHLLVPLLAVPAAAWIAQLLGRRIEGRLLIFPNIAILLAAVAVNSMWILPRLRHDETLLPLVEKAKSLVGPEGKVIDLSGGGKGCYLACKTDLAVAGGLFDMSLHRFHSGSLSEKELARAL
ncbi:MAG: glycosyltransferase 87 family protein, partial [Planctomycetota bacterium]